MARLGAAQRRIPLHAFVEVDLRFRLIADKVVGNSDESLGTRDSRRVADLPRNPLGLEGNRQQVPILAGPAIEHVQPCQQPELVGEIAESISDLKTATERALSLLAVALREHEGMAQRRLQFQLPRTPAARVIEGRQRTTGPETSLVQQVELDKQPGAGPSQRHAEVGAVVLRIGPGQRGPGIGEQAGTLLRRGA